MVGGTALARSWVARAVVAALVATTLAVAPGRPAAAADLPATTVEHDWAFAAQQALATDTRLSPPAYPQRTGGDGNWLTVGAADWTSGFFPGTLWLLYERTGDTAWRDRALTWQNSLEAQKTNAVNHDVGFKMFISYGNGYRLLGNDTYRQVLLTSAATLASRWDPDVQLIRSLGPRDATTEYRVVVDNLMNLELLFWAADHGGNPAWRTMATTHALNTIRDFVRADGSVYHLVNYNPSTGAVVSKGTIQGYAAESTWSRAQAWAVAGFTLAYRYTGDTRFLAAARRTADYWIAHVPSDWVPYWDFELPSLTGEPRDSSAAAITASGLLELAGYETDLARALTEVAVARDTLASLSSPAYLAEGTNNAAVLLHGTRHKPQNSYDHGLVFGDYYFLEALNRWEDIAGPQPPTAPDAAFTANVTSGPAPLAVQFTDTSTGGPTSWAWNFGDPGSGAANTSTLRNPTHTYATPGTYTVRLTATNAVGSDTLTRTGLVSVTAPPTNPDFAVSVTPTSATVARGGTATYTVRVTPTGGWTTPVRMSVTGVPSLASATFQPTSTLTTSTLRVTTQSALAPRSYTLRVKGIANGVIRSVEVTLRVT